MEWVKDIIGMKYYWLISTCFFFCFVLSLLLGINSIFLSLVSLSLCLPHCFSVFFSILKVFSFYLSIFLVFLYFVFLFSWCCLSFSLYFSISIFTYLNMWRPFVSERFLPCSIVIFHSSPTNKTSSKTALIIFNIFTFSVFELLSVLAWAFFNKKHFAVFNTELIERFHRERMAFWGFVLFMFK